MPTEREWGLCAGRIRTLDPSRPEVECVAIRGGRILAAGTRGETEPMLRSGADWLDLGSAVVTPGLIDSHIHLSEWASSRAAPDLSAARSPREVLARVAEASHASPPDAWIELRNWNPDACAGLGMEDLDAAAAGRAVGLIAYEMHTGWLSSEALNRLRIGPNTPDPAGGAIERDERGRPTGVLREEALGLWYSGRPSPSVERRSRALREAERRLHELGIVGVHSVEGPDSFDLLQRLDAAGELRMHVLQHLPYRHLDEVIACGIRTGFGGERLRVGGIKIFTDGTLGSRTAWMLEPYEGTSDRGICRVDPDTLRTDVGRAAAAGLSATVHAIGDAAVRMTLEALESADAARLAMPHRIEHMQCVQPDDLGRAARAGIVASMQPAHLFTDMSLADRAWGTRSRGAYACRSLLDAGTVLAFGSDAPVIDPDPRAGLFAARTRRDLDGSPDDGWHPEERLTGDEALAAYTIGPAHAAGASDRRGRLAAGYAADLVAWDRDPVGPDAQEALEARVLATVIDGEIVHRA